jgi:hypothetical protein
LCWLGVHVLDAQHEHRRRIRWIKPATYLNKLFWPVPSASQVAQD